MAQEAQLSPPPLFKQGASQNLKLLFLTLFAFFFLYVDNNYNALSFFRKTLWATFTPIQSLARLPQQLFQYGNEYALLVLDTRAENQELRRRLNAALLMTQNSAHLQAENIHLRQMLTLRTDAGYQLRPSEIIAETRSPFYRRIVIDQGNLSKVEQGMPVISPQGLIGQISRVYLNSSEVTLATDRNLSVPVQIPRTGLRAVAYGNNLLGQIDVRFVPSNADVKVGDDVVTSGIDALYPVGIPVCRVRSIDASAGSPFSTIRCAPFATEQQSQFFIVLTPQRDKVGEKSSKDQAVNRALPKDTKNEAKK